MMQRTKLFESDKPEPVATQVVIPGESIWEHIQRTGHQQFFRERIKVFPVLHSVVWVTTCAICSEQTYADYHPIVKDKRRVGGFGADFGDDWT